MVSGTRMLGAASVELCGPTGLLAPNGRTSFGWVTFSSEIVGLDGDSIGTSPFSNFQIFEWSRSKKENNLSPPCMACPKPSEAVSRFYWDRHFSLKRPYLHLILCTPPNLMPLNPNIHSIFTEAQISTRTNSGRFPRA